MIYRRTLLASALLFALRPAQAQDVHCSILVVGAGGAGLAAALEAAERVRSVVLIEKESFIGGDTLYSGGYFNAPNTEYQSRVGIKDSIDLYLNQIRQSSGGKGNPKVQERLAKEAYGTLKWLQAHGVAFQDEIYQIYGSQYRRSHKPTTALGRAYVQNLSEACLKKGVSILTNTKLEDFEILPNQKGFVAKVNRNGSVKNYVCKALILCAGGFGNNPTLLKRYVPDLNFVYSDSRGTGEVLEKAMERGILVENMDAVELIPEGSTKSEYSARIYAMAPGLAFINEDGERFVEESSSRKAISDALIKQGTKKCWTIIDNEKLYLLDKSQRKNLYRALFAGQVWKNDSLEALSREIGVPYQKLLASLEQISKEDRPHKPPFWAVRMYPIVHYTTGGISIDEDARCLNKYGIPIPGLFAAGQITGSVHGESRMGGNGLTDALTFGRLAGKNAANWIIEDNKS